jgi:hypothetical protein
VVRVTTDAPPQSLPLEIGDDRFDAVHVHGTPTRSRDARKPSRSRVRPSRIRALTPEYRLRSHGTLTYLAQHCKPLYFMYLSPCRLVTAPLSPRS